MTTTTTTAAPTITTPATGDEPKDWTIAYRRRTGNVFHRVTNWAGTWAEAREMAGAFGELNPDLQVWYTTTAAHEAREVAELPARIAAGVAVGLMSQDLADSYLEDHGNIMVDSGKRVKVRDNGLLPAELLDADLMKVAGELNASSRIRKGHGITTTDAKHRMASPRECRDYAQQIRESSPPLFADMVRVARTADERWSALCKN